MEQGSFYEYGSQSAGQKLPGFVEPGYLLLCSYETATSANPRLVECSPHTHISYLISILILSSNLRLGLQRRFFPLLFPITIVSEFISTTCGKCSSLTCTVNIPLYGYYYSFLIHVQYRNQIIFLFIFNLVTVIINNIKQAKSKMNNV
jgi:hypothetical protein